MSAVLFPAPLLSVERLSIQFGTQRVVDDVSFALWPGKTLCIAGDHGFASGGGTDSRRRDYF